MNLEDIKKILVQEEGIKIEFKKAKNAAPKSLYETVVSFYQYRWGNYCSWCR